MNRIRRAPTSMLVILLALLLTTLLTAQTFRGRVQGVVTDDSKAIIAAAPVTLTNINTGVKVVRTTSDTGLYLFDNVDPGTYSVTIEAPGFGKFVQENILVQSGGDVSVDATLKPGSINSSITVSETPAALEFNSSNKDITLDTKMAEETPRLDRNPFKLTLLAPSAVNTRGEMQPYHSWSMNSVDLGGGTNLANDLLVDGSPIGIGHKGSYPPNTDAVQEVIVSGNSVDAEVGHSAGGMISMTTKGGTNDWHGTGFYLGRYPWASAEADRTRFSLNSQRQHMFGGTIGNPILKNKLFNFVSLEYWKVSLPNSYVNTVPTALEQTGDFSQSYNVDGTQKTIWDPYSTKVDAAGNVTRTPFAGNKIPSTRFDPVTAGLMKQFWGPNVAGDNITGVNNYKKGFIEKYNYYNWSERADYNINDKWRAFGRIGRYFTDDIAGNPTPLATTSLYVPTGTERAAWQVAGDVTWTASARTVVDMRGDWHKVVDAYVSSPLEGGWGTIWPNNSWYKNYTTASTGVPLYFPHLNIGGYGYGGGGFYWDQRPQGESFAIKMSHQRGSHYLKVGLEFRESYGVSYVSSTTNFAFNTALTAETYNNPVTLKNGSPWATFLLGSMDDGTQMIGGPAPDPHNQYWGMFFQDDWKLSKNVTLNLGIRNDYEKPWWDPAHNFSKGLDLSQPIPEMVSNPPAVPGAVSSILGNNPWKYNGQWKWTTDSSPGMWNAPKLALMPRAGIAIRLSDTMSIRAGYARYTIPSEFNLSGAPGFETVSFLEPPYFGVTSYQNTAPLLQGIPQQTFADPYPASVNPLLAIQGKAAGGNVGRGQNGALLWYKQDFVKPYNDRINIAFQRQLPGQVVVSAGFFTNFGHQLYNQQLNQIDPQIRLKYQNTLSQNVDNPFYHYLNQTIMPGPLYNQKTVPLSSLLTPYPQYAGLAEFGQCCASERYNSLELKAQKIYSKGYNVLFAYVFIREKNQIYFNDTDTFTNHLTYQDSNQPRHRITAASTYELPFGRGKQYLNSVSRGADMLVGGWKVVGSLTVTSGDFLRFDNLVVNGNPCISNPSPQKWFNTSAFSPIPANTYAIRSNPLQYDCLTGPKFFNLDATLTKGFKITEKVRTELKMAAYNATNHLNRGDPDTGVNNSTFGQALYQGSPGGGFGQQGATYGGQSGRQIEMGLKIIF